MLTRTSTPVRISPSVAAMALMSIGTDLLTLERDILIRKNICTELPMIGLLRETDFGAQVRYPASLENLVRLT